MRAHCAAVWTALRFQQDLEMSAPPQMLPRRSSGVRVMLSLEGQPSSLPIYTNIGKKNVTKATSGTGHSSGQSSVNAEREVEILNHCFDDIERFMLRLQQTAEAQSVLNQRKHKKSRKNKKKEEQEDDLLNLKACPPPEEEFVEIYQKFKYSFGLLDRLKSSLSKPSALELLHHIFVPLRLMVKTTGPELAASVIHPALTSGAVTLLQQNLKTEEKELWTSLGQNWTTSWSHLGLSVHPYSPVFLDGWRPATFDSSGQPIGDPIESQHKQDSFRESQSVQNQAQHAEGSGCTDQIDGNGLAEGERLYVCSYDFVARNSSELSVLQGDTLEVLESSKRWWKCRNRFNQIGFVPHNILEPLSELNRIASENKVARRETKTDFVPRSKYFSYAPTSAMESSPTADGQPVRPHSMVLPSTTLQGDNNNRVLVMNNELLERLERRTSSNRRLVIPKTAETSAPLDYHSPPSEVQAWLTAKGFKEQTVESLGVLNGAQLFSLNKKELCTVSLEEGARVYSQVMMQKALLEDVRKASELEAAMEKQKLKQHRR